MSYLAKNLNLTQLTKHLNENFEKSSGLDITISDTQGYVHRGSIPTYMGGNVIDKVEEFKGITLYNLKKN